MCKIFLIIFFLFLDIKIYLFYDMLSEINGLIIGVIGNVLFFDDYKLIIFIFFLIKNSCYSVYIIYMEYYC